MRLLRAPLLFVLLAICHRDFLAPASAGDWPQYRGPMRNDISEEADLLQTWPADGPKLLWTFDALGAGYAGPAVVGKRLYVLGDRGDDCFLIALDLPTAADGKPREAWALRVGEKFDFEGNAWSSGPSATPTVDGDRIYALGGNGDLLCASDAGRELWRKSLPTELEAEVNPIGGGPKKLGWGFTWSPLVDGDRLICIPGGPKGTVAALDKLTGAVVWRSTEATDQAAYTSPMLAEIDGVRQYVVLTNQGLLGVAADDGKLLWSHRRRWGTEVVNSPLVHGRKIFVTVGAGGGCELVEVKQSAAAWEVVSLYSNKNLANHHGNIVLLGDKLYGNSQGSGWTVLGFETGEIVASERKIPAGAITFADGRLYLVSERDGATMLLDPTKPAGDGPQPAMIAGRLKLPQASDLRKPKGGFWTPPVVSHGRLYLRDQNLLFCYDVAK